MEQHDRSMAYSAEAVAGSNPAARTRSLQSSWLSAIPAFGTRSASTNDSRFRTGKPIEEPETQLEVRLAATRPETDAISFGRALDMLRKPIGLSRLTAGTGMGKRIVSIMYGVTYSKSAIAASIAASTASSSSSAQGRLAIASIKSYEIGAVSAMLTILSGPARSVTTASITDSELPRGSTVNATCGDGRGASVRYVLPTKCVDDSQCIDGRNHLIAANVIVIRSTIRLDHWNLRNVAHPVQMVDDQQGIDRSDVSVRIDVGKINADSAID